MLTQKTIDRLCDLQLNSLDSILRNLDDCVFIIKDKVFLKIEVACKYMRYESVSIVYCNYNFYYLYKVVLRAYEAI